MINNPENCTEWGHPCFALHPCTQHLELDVHGISGTHRYPQGVCLNTHTHNPLSPSKGIVVKGQWQT